MLTAIPPSLRSSTPISQLFRSLGSLHPPLFSLFISLSATLNMSSITGINTKAFKNGDAEPTLKPGAARIYSMRFCPWAERTLLYAAAKGIEAEIVNINLKEKPAWYFEHHPKGQVPTFEKDGKNVIESGIVPEYLDGIYPETSILPEDPYERAQQKILVQQLAGLAPAYYGVVLAAKDVTEGPAIEEKLKNVEAALDNAEKLLTHDYYGGSSPGYADWLTFPFFERINIASHIVHASSIDSKDFPSPSRWPKLTAYWSLMSNHPAVKAVTQPVDYHLQFVKGFTEGNPEYDIGI